MNMRSALASKKISEKAGPGLQSECADYVSDKGPLALGGIYTSGGYNLSCQHVIHVYCPNSAQVSVNYCKLLPNWFNEICSSVDVNQSTFCYFNNSRISNICIGDNVRTCRLSQRARTAFMALKNFFLHIKKSRKECSSHWLYITYIYTL